MFGKVLVANRGEIAIRIFHTLREMDIQTVAVYTEPDAQALHVRTADESRPIKSYLDAADIVRVARNDGADAIHPGYGFLSENPLLAAACESSGLTFIGPRAETIRQMADKLESKRVMERAGIPVVPSWEREPPVSEFPVLVKAVGGGGGKGMRLVERPSDLPSAMASASHEARQAFGDDRVFVEKYIRCPRHIEFQILGDSNGNVTHLFERECSIQRRHQKIIEETPSTALTPGLRTRMAEAAVAAARAVAYLNTGTVEFILDANGHFYFLEMNTRLQVEHPVTEMTTGTDLVREQVLLAEGNSLSTDLHDVHQTGHSIECRIYAEVPEENFRPSTGTIRIYHPPDGPGIRLDSGVAEGSVVSFHYDPLLAKLIVWAATRKAAIQRMRHALEDFVLLGVRNNIEFLHHVIANADFTGGRIDTQFIDSHPEFFQFPSNELPLEALLAASLGSPNPPLSSPHDGRASSFSEVWSAGHWRLV